MIGFTASREELGQKVPEEPDAPEGDARKELSCTGATTQINVSQPKYGWRSGQVTTPTGRQR